MLLLFLGIDTRPLSLVHLKHTINGVYPQDIVILFVWFLFLWDLKTRSQVVRVALNSDPSAFSSREIWFETRSHSIT